MKVSLTHKGICRLHLSPSVCIWKILVHVSRRTAPYEVLELTIRKIDEANIFVSGSGHYPKGKTDILG